MESTTIIQTLLGIVGFLSSGAIVMLFKKQAATEKTTNDLRVHVAENCVAKADYKADIIDLKGTLNDMRNETRDTLGKLFDKLDSKADKQ